MVLGMSLSTFTLLHVLMSLAGIASGFVVVYGWLTARRLDGWTAIFLSTTVLTSLSGYLFPVQHLMPSHVIGALSLSLLTIAIFARYRFHMAGIWTRGYVVTAAMALYLNCFVAIVQAFEKVPTLKAMAPTGKEAPFVAAQLIVLAIFVVITILAAKRFKIGEAPEVVKRQAA